jgi:RNA polymerase sigma-70 factor, ECF subfamily
VALEDEPKSPMGARVQPGALEEHRLLERIAGGDALAFQGVYEQYAAVVFAVLLAMLGSAAESEELRQEVFLALWREASRFDPARGSLRAWLQVITRRRALDALRGRRSRPQPAASKDALHALCEAQDGETPEQAASQRERACAVGRALAALPEAERQALYLVYFRGLSPYQIGPRLGIPVGTIKSRVRVGMLRLRDALSQHRG